MPVPGQPNVPHVGKDVTNISPTVDEKENQPLTKAKEAELKLRQQEQEKQKGLAKVDGLVRDEKAEQDLQKKLEPLKKEDEALKKSASQGSGDQSPGKSALQEAKEEKPQITQEQFMAGFKDTAMTKDQFLTQSKELKGDAPWDFIWEELGPFLAQLVLLLWKRKKTNAAQAVKPMTVEAQAVRQPTHRETLERLADLCVQCE